MTISPIGGPAPRGNRSTGPTDEDVVLRELRKARKRGRTVGELRAMTHFLTRHNSVSRLLHDMRDAGTLVTLEDVRLGDRGRDQHIHVLPLFVDGRTPHWGRQKPVAICHSCGAIQG